MYSFVLALLIRQWASASATPLPAVSNNRSATLEMVQRPGLVNTTLLTPESNNFPDPYDFVVVPQVLTIEFYGYQGTINHPNLNKCIRAVNDDVFRKTAAGRAQASMGVDPYVYSTGNVTLYLSPDERLTWGKWSLAPAAIKRFVQENGLRGTQFILLWRGSEPMGYGQLVTIEEGTQSPTTTTTTTNATATAIRAFPDPFDRHWDSAGLTLEFYGYRGSIPPFAMSACIVAACDDFRTHISSIQKPMTETASSFSYSAGDVYLVLVPTENLYWYMWGFLPFLIQTFVTENEFKGTQFIIIKDGVGPIGYGHLLDEWGSGLSLLDESRDDGRSVS